VEVIVLGHRRRRDSRWHRGIADQRALVHQTREAGGRRRRQQRSRSVELRGDECPALSPAAGIYGPQRSVVGSVIDGHTAVAVVDGLRSRVNLISMQRGASFRRIEIVVLVIDIATQYE